MITDGLKLAAGDRLKLILEQWTTTRLRGVASGVLVTAVVQSSSAVTVATIGFVNAGLLTLGQSLGVIYGANVGTTMTGWIVAAIGFDFSVEALALPMVGIGMFARVIRPESRIGDLGTAFAGFGLFFVGIDLMKEAFQAIATSVDVAALEIDGVFGTLAYVALGAVMTVMTQSSSAAIAITLTAATGGLLAIDAAAAAVIGANIGTTSTAAFAVIGATANARRVAAAHVIFNFVTAAVALLLLPIMLWLVRATGSFLGLSDVPAVSLALFHTIFNTLGVALMWPFTTRLSAYLSGKFTTQAELLSRPQFLDSNVLATPDLAAVAINRELGRASNEVREIVIATFTPGKLTEKDWRYRRAGLETLLDAIADSVASLEKARLPENLRGSMPQALRVIGYLEEILNELDDYREHLREIHSISRPEVLPEIETFYRSVLDHILRCDPNAPDFLVESLNDDYKALRESWRAMKTHLLEAASAGTVPVGPLNLALEGMRSSLRTAERFTRAAQRLFELTRTHTKPQPGPSKRIEPEVNFEPGEDPDFGTKEHDEA
jgi:phosphate:Na+ symporter